MRPNSGVIAEGGSVEIQVTLQPEKGKSDENAIDKFLVQTLVISSDMDTSDVSKLIQKNKGKLGEKKLKSYYTLSVDSGAGGRSTKSSRSGGASDRTVEALQKERNEYREQLTKLNVELKKSKTELEKIRSSGGSDLKNRFTSKSTGGASSGSSSSSAVVKAGHSTLLLLLASTIMFAAGFYTHMHVFPDMTL